MVSVNGAVRRSLPENKRGSDSFRISKGFDDSSNQKKELTEKENDMQNKKQEIPKVRIIVAVVVMLIAAVMAVYSIMTLPAEVATQFEGFMNTGAPAVPKFVAVAVPFAICTVFSLKSLSEPKSIFICLIGYVMNVLFWLCN